MGIYSDELFPISEEYADLLNGLGDTVSSRVEQRIIESYDELLTEIDSSWNDIAQNKSIIPQQQRLLIAEELGELLKVIRPDLAEGSLEDILEEAVRDAADISDRYYRAVQSVVNVNPDMRQTLQATTGVPLDALRNQAEEGMNRLYRHGEDQASKISAIIENGLIQNRSVRTVMDDIESIVGLSTYPAERIARTEIMGAFGGGAIGRAIEDGALIQWVTFRDEFVCPYCTARNMRVYRPEDIRFPLHPFDRCNMLPVFEEWLDDEDIIDADDTAFMAAHRKTGLDTLRAAGKSPNYGAGPFDVDGAPQPVWSP